jgi:hypothetical protein
VSISYVFEAPGEATEGRGEECRSKSREVPQ